MNSSKKFKKSEKYASVFNEVNIIWKSPQKHSYTFTACQDDLYALTDILIQFPVWGTIENQYLNNVKRTGSIFLSSIALSFMSILPGSVTGQWLSEVSGFNTLSTSNSDNTSAQTSKRGIIERAKHRTLH